MGKPPQSTPTASFSASSPKPENHSPTLDAGPKVDTRAPPTDSTSAHTEKQQPASASSAQSNDPPPTTTKRLRRRRHLRNPPFARLLRRRHQLQRSARNHPRRCPETPRRNSPNTSASTQTTRLRPAHKGATPNAHYHSQRATQHLGIELFAEDSRYRNDGYTILRTDLCLRTPRRHAQVHMKPDEAAETWFQTHQNHLDTGSAAPRPDVHLPPTRPRRPHGGLQSPPEAHRLWAPCDPQAHHLHRHQPTPPRPLLPARVRAMAWAVGPTAAYIPIQLSPRQQPVLLAIVDGTVAAGLMTMLQG